MKLATVLDCRGLMNESLENTANKRRRTQAERSDEAISALRETALEMLLDGGVGALNLSELGDRAGYSRGIVHYHFGSKESLLADLLQSLAESGREVFVEVEDTGVDGLLRILEILEERARQRPREALARILLINEAIASNSDRLRQLAIDYNRAVRAAFQALVRSDTRIRAPGVSPDELGELILSAIRGAHHQWLAEREAFDIGAALRAMERIIAAAAGVRS